MPFLGLRLQSKIEIPLTPVTLSIDKLTEHTWEVFESFIWGIWKHMKSEHWKTMNDIFIQDIDINWNLINK
jgi:hypothetical protein